MGTYSALGPTIKQAVERLEKAHQLDRVLQSETPEKARPAAAPKKSAANEHK